MLSGRVKLAEESFPNIIRKGVRRAVALRSERRRVNQLTSNAGPFIAVGSKLGGSSEPRLNYINNIDGAENGSMDYWGFLRKEQPSVRRALPPVGWQRTVLQAEQITT
jgi:hypothetical protein